jgi:hypothetical protein
MPSTISSFIFAFTVLLVILAILGTIIGYYSSIINEPALLPAYGTIYVEGVSKTTNSIDIINTYGYSAKALFAIYVDSIDNIPQNSYALAWRTLAPGLNTVELNKIVSEYMRISPDKAIVINFEKSYFLIGEVKYPLIQGAGLYSQQNIINARTKTYTASGIGPNQPISTLYTSLYFSSSKTKITHSTSAQFGYLRGITGYSTATPILLEEYGTRCKTLPPVTWYWVYDSARGACQYKVVTCDMGSYPSYYYNIKYGNPYGYAYAGNQLYWTTPAKTEYQSDFNTISLYGLSYFEIRRIARDMRLYYGGGSEWTYGTWPYFTGQSYVYTQTYRTWTASISKYEWRWCTDSYCGLYYPYYYCQESSNDVLRTVTACYASDGGLPLCANLNTYLASRIVSTYMNVTSLLYSGSFVRLQLNMTYVFQYFKVNYDPLRSDNYMHLLFSDVVRFDLPSIVGYVGIPYTDDLSGVVVNVYPSVNYYSARISTSSGYKSGVFLDVQPRGGSYSADVSPVGKVAVSSSSVESAKTFQYGVSGSFVSISLSSPWDGFYLPYRDGDTVTLNVFVDFYIVPVLNVSVVSGVG